MPTLFPPEPWEKACLPYLFYLARDSHHLLTEFYTMGFLPNWSSVWILDVQKEWRRKKKEGEGKKKGGGQEVSMALEGVHASLLLFWEWEKSLPLSLLLQLQCRRLQGWCCFMVAVRLGWAFVALRPILCLLFFPASLKVGSPFIFVFVVMGMEPGILTVPGQRCSTAYLYPYPPIAILVGDQFLLLFTANFPICI